MNLVNREDSYWTKNIDGRISCFGFRARNCALNKSAFNELILKYGSSEAQLCIC